MKRAKAREEFSKIELRMWCLDRAIEASGDRPELMGLANIFYKWVIDEPPPWEEKPPDVPA